jgi:predicted nucleic-acid-binding protein
LGWQTVKIAADTNVLLRIVVDDDAEQRKLAEVELANAETIAIPIVVLCELVWTLLRLYQQTREDIAADVRRLINASNVVVNRGAADAGLAMLDDGGDFAEGVIAHEGRALGADCLVSFDRQAAKLLTARGEAVRLLTNEALP